MAFEVRFNNLHTWWGIVLLVAGIFGGGAIGGGIGAIFGLLIAKIGNSKELPQINKVMINILLTILAIAIDFGLAILIRKLLL